MARSKPRLSKMVVPSVTRKCWKPPLPAGSQHRHTCQKEVINNNNNNNNNSFAFHPLLASQNLKKCSHNNATKLLPSQQGWMLRPRRIKLPFCGHSSLIPPSVLHQAYRHSSFSCAPLRGGTAETHRVHAVPLCHVMQSKNSTQD